MFRDFFRNSGWFFKLVQLVMLAFFFTFIGYGIWMMLARGDAESLNSMKLLQLISEITIFIIPAMIVGNLWYDNPVERYKMDVSPKKNHILLVVALMVALLPFINLMSYLNEQLELPAFMSGLENQMKTAEKMAAELTEKFLKMDSFGTFLFHMLFIAVIPAFGEEIFFRGAVFNALSERFRNHLAIWLTAALFSFIHFQFYGFLPRMVIGAVFGYLLLWSRSLWLPVLAHFLNNAMAVTAAYIAGGQDQVKELDTLGKADTVWAGLLSAVVSGFILWRIFKTRESLPPKSPQGDFLNL